MNSNSITQYLELYRDNAATIDANSAPALNAMRRPAAEALEGAALPRRGDEGYARTDLNAMFAPDYGLNISRIDLPADIEAAWRCDLPNMSTLQATVASDSFIPGPSLTRLLPEGVIFDSLAATASRNPEALGGLYGTIAPLTDPAVAINTMLTQDGVIIRIPRGLKMPRPLQLVNILSAPVAMMTPRRMLIILEPDAEAQILICDNTQRPGTPYLTSEVIEVDLARGSRLDLYTIEDSSAYTSRISRLYARQHEASELHIVSSTLTCGTTRNDFNIRLEGPHTHTSLSAMAIASAKMKIDNAVDLRHLSHHGTSRQLFKYVADDEASAAFEGLITVSPEAPYTDASQTCRTVLASPDARMHAEPQLIIDNDEVRCSHGATSGQLDEEALFYMRSRGIPEKEARTMLMQAFMADVIDTVSLESLRDRLRHLVERRFAADSPASCAECHTACHKS